MYWIRLVFGIALAVFAALYIATGFMSLPIGTAAASIVILGIMVSPYFFGVSGRHSVRLVRNCIFSAVAMATLWLLAAVLRWSDLSAEGVFRFLVGGGWMGVALVLGVTTVFGYFVGIVLPSRAGGDTRNCAD